MNETMKSALTDAIYGVSEKECKMCGESMFLSSIFTNGREDSFCIECFDKVQKLLRNLESKGHIVVVDEYNS